MYETTSTFLQAELDYRYDRLKDGLTGPRRRHHGLTTRVRRRVAAPDPTR